MRSLDLGDPMVPNMGVTGNTQLLMGFMAGSLHDPYEVASWDAEAGRMIVRSLNTGNTYGLSFVQLTGEE